MSIVGVLSNVGAGVPGSPVTTTLEALSKEWPQYAFWLVTGVSDPDYGHVSPTSTGTYTVVKGAEQEYSTQEFRYLIDKRRHEPQDDTERAKSRREIEDEVFELRKKNLIPATYFNYEQAMRGYDEPGRSDFYLIETDEQLHAIRRNRRAEIQRAQETVLQWRENVAKNKKAEQFIRKLVSKVWR